ncbi:hypothetical protein F4558_003993 [Micromonospora profundi]|nr:hypothetical protein [Micromonospora profundi]
MAGQELAQRRTGGDRLAGAYRRLDRLVGGPQTAGVAHGDHRSAGHHAGEEHGARPGAADHRAGLGGKVHAPVPGQPRPGRRVEPAHQAGRPVDRPAERRRPGVGGRQPRHRDGRGRRAVRYRREDQRQAAELDGQCERKCGAEQHGTADRAEARGGWRSHDGSLRPRPSGPPPRKTKLWTTSRVVDDHPKQQMICYAQPAYRWWATRR